MELDGDYFDNDDDDDADDSQETVRMTMTMLNYHSFYKQINSTHYRLEQGESSTKLATTSENAIKSLYRFNL